MAKKPTKTVKVNNEAKSKAVIEQTANRTTKEIFQQAKQRFEALVDNEQEERQKQLDDLKFADEDQWTNEIRNARENAPNGSRPVLTIDKINQYISQIENEVRKNKPGIKVRPVDDKADVRTAEVLQGITRRIEDNSKADIAYVNAASFAVKMGCGYWRIVTDYEDEMSFNQEPQIEMVPDPFKVYLGEHNMPDGSDATYGFIFEDMPDEEFKRLYPKAKPGDDDSFQTAVGHDQEKYWRNGQTTRVVEHYYFDYRKMNIVQLADGQTMEEDEYKALAESGAHILPPIVNTRETTTHDVRWVKMTGAEVLEEGDWLGKYVPIIKVVGKQSNVAGKKHFKGLVRLAKDSLRAYNYWFSSLTEKMALAPKSPFIGAVGQFDTHRDRWQKANIENYAYLEYDPVEANGMALPPPQRTPPTQMEAAMAAQLQIIEHNIETALGMFKASVGKAQPQQSGKAVMALKNQTDQGTFNFPDNVALSIRYTGVQLIGLIPKLYDTKRIVRILGEDGSEQKVNVNPSQGRSVQTDGIQAIYDLKVGKYDVTATPGASYATKRMEQTEVLMQILQNQPDLMPVMGDLLFKGMDFPMAQEIAKRFQAQLPPGMKPQQDGELPPEVLQIIEDVQKQAQELEQRAQALDEAEKEIHKAGLEVGKQSLKVMAQEENNKTESKRIEVARLGVQLMEDALEMDKEDPAAIDSRTKLKLAEVEQETKYVVALLQAHSKEQAERMKDNALRRAAGERPLEDEEAEEKHKEEEDMRLEETKQAVIAMMNKIAELQSEIAKVADKPAPVIDTSGIEKTIATLGKEIKEKKEPKKQVKEDIVTPLNKNMEVMSEILAYLKAPKKAVKNKKGDWTVRVKR